MRLLAFADAHIAERPPIARSESYTDDIFDKMSEVKILAADCDVSIFLGDLLHWPSPSATSHRLVRRLIEFLRDWPGRLLLVCGNHDLPSEGMAGLSRSALGVVLEALHGTNVQLLDDDVVLDVGFAGLSRDARVQLSPAHWSASIDSDPGAYAMTRQSGVDVAIKIGHGMLMPPGEYPFKCVTFPQIQTEADVVLVGHLHWATPPTTVNGTLFLGPGSIARTSRSPIEMKRQVQVAILGYAGGKLTTEFVSLRSMRPAEEVFVWQEQREEPGALLEGYVAVLESGLDVGGLSVEDALRDMEGRAPEGVAALARRYLVDAGL